MLLVSGSGSQDRDQIIGGFKTFQKLAVNLFDEVYSTFRYDDRGVGASTGNTDVTLDQMAEDVVNIVDYLKSEYSESISGVVLLGHNQGGIVASLAANRTDADGVILAASPFLPGDKIISEQIEKIAETREISDEIVEQNLRFQEEVFNVVRTGSGWEEIEAELAGRLEEQIRELPIEHQNALGDMSAFIHSEVERQLETAKSQWFKSWIEIDPTEIVEKVKVPVLALFGEKDTQVLPESNKEIADSLADASEVSFQAVIINDANHLFQAANTGMPSEYGMLEHEFTDSFILEIDQFLDSIQFRSPD